METTTCCVCNIEFGLPGTLMRRRRDDGRTLYCPNGHSLSFQPSKIDKLRKKNLELAMEIQQLTKDVEFWTGLHDRLLERYRVSKSEATTAKLRAAGYKSQWLRIKSKASR